MRAEIIASVASSIGLAKRVRPVREHIATGPDDDEGRPRRESNPPNETIAGDEQVGLFPGRLTAERQSSDTPLPVRAGADPGFRSYSPPGMLALSVAAMALWRSIGSDPPAF